MRRFLRFNLTGALGIGVQLGTLSLLVHQLGMDYRAATALAVACAVLHNFVWHWRWTWRDRDIPLADTPSALARFAMANGLVSLGGNLVLMTLLVGGAGLPPVAANVIAIACCGLINYVLGDRVVFRQAPVRHGVGVGPHATQ